LDKLRLRGKRHLQPEARVRVLRHQPILLRQRSSQLQRDSKHLQRICHQANNRLHRRENPVQQVNLEHPAP
jgi:hypothetical protein